MGIANSRLQVTDSGHVRSFLYHSPKNNCIKNENLQNSITLRPLGAVWRAGYLGLIARGDLSKNQVFGTVRDDGDTPPHPKERKGTDQESDVFPVTLPDSAGVEHICTGCFPDSGSTAGETPARLLQTPGKFQVTSNRFSGGAI